MDEVDFQGRMQELAELPFREDFYTALCELYRSASVERREVLRRAYRQEELGSPSGWRYKNGDSTRMDLTRKQHYWETLILLSIEDGSDDDRNDLRCVAACYHNLDLAGVNGAAALGEVAGMSSGKMAKLILGFLALPASGKSLKAWDLEVVETERGAEAVSSWRLRVGGHGRRQ